METKIDLLYEKKDKIAAGGGEKRIADANTVLNTIAAEAFSRFAGELEKAEDKERAARELIRKEYEKHLFV